MFLSCIDQLYMHEIKMFKLICHFHMCDYQIGFWAYIYATAYIQGVKSFDNNLRPISYCKALTDSISIQKNADKDTENFTK